MFKTIHECGLELAACTATNAYRDVRNNSPDLLPARAARASFMAFDKSGKDVEADVKLINSLAREGHTSCFEHQSATFLLEVPLFIRSQIHRHRTFAYNEVSRRYTSENLEFWIPDVFRGQAKRNRQCSEGECSDQEALMEGYKVHCTESLKTYEWLISAGQVAREQARAVLPQSLLTRFYMTGNLRNWQHFIELRRDGHAQYEVQVVANRIADSLRSLWPESCKALGV